MSLAENVQTVIKKKKKMLLQTYLKNTVLVNPRFIKISI